jgi:hypothetical protein
MSLTLRQLQKLFSTAARTAQRQGWHSSLELAEVAAPLAKNERQAGSFRGAGSVLVCPDGSLVNNCGCSDCRAAGDRIAGVRSVIDRWTRQYGPDADAAEVARQEMAKKNPEGENQPGEDGEQQDQPGTPKPQQNQQQPCVSSPGQSQSQTQATGPAPETGKPQPPAKSPQQVALEKARAALTAARVKTGENPAKKAETRYSIRAAKKALEIARRAASYNKEAEAAGVSLAARREIAGSNGRLRRVPQRLRSQMASLINQLVEQGGVVGETYGPIPVLSATKLVKRMVVHRPLANALKEDSVSGRPVTLFLPDVSPSCAAQAQVACDLANAAGYAGVTGSDVLVFPHSNGCVDSDESYIPWFNGKPATTNYAEIKTMFSDICNGRSRFRIRVVVFLGDHDAVQQYGEIAKLASVRRALWLHNYSDSERRQKPSPAQQSFLPGPEWDWAPEATDKLSMVVGCVDQPTMLTGFKLALSMR